MLIATKQISKRLEIILLTRKLEKDYKHVNLREEFPLRFKTERRLKIPRVSTRIRNEKSKINN